MSVKSRDLRNTMVPSTDRQRDEQFDTNEPHAPTEATPPVDKYAKARDLRPPSDHTIHCAHCWGTGRDAAIKVIEEGS